MTDKDFVDVGDELVVRIGGYPVAKAEVKMIGRYILVALEDGYTFRLPLDFTTYEDVDGVAHGIG